MKVLPKNFNIFYDSDFRISRVDENGNPDENFGARMLVEMYIEDLIRLQAEVNHVVSRFRHHAKEIETPCL